MGNTVATFLGALDAAIVTTPSPATVRDAKSSSLGTFVAIRHFAEPTGLVELAESAEEAVGRAVAVLLRANEASGVRGIHEGSVVHRIRDEAETHALTLHRCGD